MRGLYPIVDVEVCERHHLDPAQVAEAVLEARPNLIELRAKHAAPSDVVRWLRRIRPLARSARALLFANDRPDVAEIAGCDGVHLGQQDLDAMLTHSFAPQLLLGVSTHSPTQVRAALVHLNLPIAYIALGPVFPTTSKANPEPVVAAAEVAESHGVTRAAGVPLVLIGGITETNCGVWNGDAELVAAIPGLMPPMLDSPARTLEHIAASARFFQRVFSGTT